MRSAFAAYKQNKFQGVQEASPAKLVALLLDEAVACCSAAAVACENGNIALKCSSISHAMSIVDSGLLAALDKERGGEIAVNLETIYRYFLGRLFEANVHSDPAIMRECAGLLGQIRQGWRAAEEHERN